MNRRVAFGLTTAFTALLTVAPLAGCYVGPSVRPAPLASVEVGGSSGQVSTSQPAEHPNVPPGDPTCPPNMRELGRTATWCGKVNVHTEPSGEWQSDADCSSGCNVSLDRYCQRLYPGTRAVVEVPVTPVDKPFLTAGCNELYPSAGHNEFVCCGE